MSERRLEILDAPWGDAADAVFDAVDRGRVAHGLDARPAGWGAWLADHPGGAHLGVARVDERVAAAIVALRREVLLEGEPTAWLEVLDVFNDFEAGRGLACTRPYLEISEHFARELGGRAPDGCPVMFGLPNRSAHRIGLARLRFEILRSENVLVADPAIYDTEPCDPDVDVEEVESFPADVGPLFERFADGRGAIGVRSKAWLDWRFARHPGRRYRIAVARRAGELAGWVVHRRGRHAGHEGGILADWLVLPGDRPVAWALLSWARDVVREEGGTSLLVNVPDKSPEWAFLQGVAFQARGTKDYLVFRGFQKPYVMSWLFASWHYTLADTERG